MLFRSGRWEPSSCMTPVHPACHGGSRDVPGGEQRGRERGSGRGPRGENEVCPWAQATLAGHERRARRGRQPEISGTWLCCCSRVYQVRQAPTRPYKPPDQDQPSPTQVSGTPFNTPPGRREYDHPLHSSALYVLYHHTRKFLALNLAAASR